MKDVWGICLIYGIRIGMYNAREYTKQFVPQLRSKRVFRMRPKRDKAISR